MHRVSGEGKLSPCTALGSTHINHWMWSQAGELGRQRIDAPVPHKSNIPVLCTHNLTQNWFIASLAAAENADTRWKAIEQWNWHSIPAWLSLHCPQLQVSPVPLPFNDTNRLLRWELVIFVPNPTQPSAQSTSVLTLVCLHLFAQAHCPEIRHNFQRDLTKPLEPDLAQPKAWQSVQGQVASLWHTRPFSAPLTKECFTLSRDQESPWPQQQRLRRKATYT